MVMLVEVAPRPGGETDDFVCIDDTNSYPFECCVCLWDITVGSPRRQLESRLMMVCQHLQPPVYSTTTVTTDLVYPQFSSTAVEPSAPCVVGSLPPVEEFTEPVYDQVLQEQIAAGEMTVDIAEIPVVHQQVIAGMRPERLVDARGPQRCDRTVPSVGAPVLAVQSLRGFDGVDNTAAKFLLQQALKLKKEKELEAHLAKWGLKPVPKGSPLMFGPLKRKRKKRRKRRTPRTSSRSLRGRARCRQRQWHSRFAGLPGDVLLRAAFPSVVVWPEMLGVMAVPEG